MQFIDAINNALIRCIPNICMTDQNIKQIESRQTKLQIYLFTIK